MHLPKRPMTKSSLLAGHTNGKLPRSILTTVPGQAGGAPVTLIHPAARSWVALCAAAKAAGHILKIGWPNSAYRSYADQERIFRQRYTTTYLPGRPYKVWNGRRWYQKPGTAVAATPGFSNHGLASAVDGGEERDSDLGTESFDDPTLRWLIANIERFGWSHEVSSEPWHLRYNAGDRIPQAVLDYEKSLAQPEKPPSEEDEDMDPVYIHFKDNRQATAKYKRYATAAEKPLVSGVHVYAVVGGIGVYQGPESMAVAEYLNKLSGKKLVKVGSATKPQTIVAPNGKADGWFIGSHLIDGPLAGIKK